MTGQTQRPTGNSPAAVEGQRSAASLINLKIINWSGVAFALLQSLCTAFIALNSVRFLVGIGALAAATSALRLADRLHVDAIRIPMMLVALLGSVLNLAVLWRAWSLRKRPASAWRQQPLSKKQKRSEFFQFSLSVLTLVLLAVELVAHHHMFAHY